MKSLRIVNKNGIGRGTQVFETETGVEVHGITSIAIDPITVNEPVTATITLHSSEMDVIVSGKFEVTHPVTGKQVAIAKIVFADGSEFDAGS